MKGLVQGRMGETFRRGLPLQLEVVLEGRRLWGGIAVWPLPPGPRGEALQG